MRQGAMEFKIARMEACHNTLAWLAKNADHIREWVQYAVKMGTPADKAEIAMEAPPDVLPAELTWEEPDGENESPAHDHDKAIGVDSSN